MKIFLAAIALALASSSALTQDHVTAERHTGMDRIPRQGTSASKARNALPSHVPADEGKLTEAGQATFAAIQEAVAILEADPKTDWSKVNIEALRRHLVDMENVMTLSRIEMVPVSGGARFVVNGSGPVVPSIQRMIAGHSMTMDDSDDWKYVSAKTAQGGTLQVTATGPADAIKIRALGFAGLMARGSHHQPHHYGMAVGKMVH